MRWKVLVAIMVGLLVGAMNLGTVHAAQHLPGNTVEKVGVHKMVISINGTRVPVEQFNNGVIIIGKTPKIGREEILKRVNQMMIQRVLNRWNDVTIESNYANTISKSNYNYRVTTFKLNANDDKKIKLSVGTALSAKFRIDYYDPIETIDFSVYNYAYSTAVSDHPPYITYYYECKSIALNNRLSFSGESFVSSTEVAFTISIPPGFTVGVSDSSSVVSIDGSFGKNSVYNHDSISNTYEDSLTSYDYFKVRIYRVTSYPKATFEVKTGTFRTLGTSTSVSVDSSAF
ncbi:hypothetical protein A3L11_01775 [Thermococcus siculi]|uniref:Uncharacterized protein n=1 Tax=Thermococcus siculi TaxID=72803 RepID=A0A2Z2MHX2_9EURY|nr:hypothetical protein [Thermococcus siculi]ASJ08022.1 hypothetical protein A3L11_01775 [Thermococcus siculi]